MNKRLELLQELTHLEDFYCGSCELVTKENMSCYIKMGYCLDYCNIGKRMREIGGEIDPSNAKTKKYTILSGELKSKITGMYQFKTAKEIAEKLGLERKVVSSYLSRWMREKKIIKDHYKYDTRRIIELDHQGLTIDEIVAKTKESKRKVTGTLEREYKRQREGFGKHE